MKGGAGRSTANCPRPVGLDLQGVREKAPGGQMTAEEKRGRGDAARPRVTLGVAPGRALSARACATAGLPLSARQKGRKPRLQLDRASFSATVPWVSTCKKGGVLRVRTNRPRRRRVKKGTSGPGRRRPAGRRVILCPRRLGFSSHRGTSLGRSWVGAASRCLPLSVSPSPPAFLSQISIYHTLNPGGEATPGTLRVVSQASVTCGLPCPRCRSRSPLPPLLLSSTGPPASEDRTARRAPVLTHNARPGAPFASSVSLAPFKVQFRRHLFVKLCWDLSPWLHRDASLGTECHEVLAGSLSALPSRPLALAAVIVSAPLPPAPNRPRQ